MTTAEQLAIAVLKGDQLAIKMLIDHLQEDMSPEWAAFPVVPVTKVTVPLERLRVIVYVAENFYVDREHLELTVREWLAGERISLGLVGVDRVEIYEMPENFSQRSRPNDQEIWPVRNHSIRHVPISSFATPIGGDVDVEQMRAMLENLYPVTVQSIPAVDDGSKGQTPSMMHWEDIQRQREEIRQREIEQIQTMLANGSAVSPMIRIDHNGEPIKFMTEEEWREYIKSLTSNTVKLE